MVKRHSAGPRARGSLRDQDTTQRGKRGHTEKANESGSVSKKNGKRSQHVGVIKIGKKTGGVSPAQRPVTWE